MRCLLPAPRRRTRRLQSSTSEGTECKKGSETFGAKRDRGAKRQCRVEFQATVLAHMQEFAGRLAALEVSGVAPIPTPCSSSPAMLGIPAASRKSSSPALHEARTVLGAGAGISHIRPLSSQLARSHQKAMCVPAKLLTLPKYL